MEAAERGAEKQKDRERDGKGRKSLEEDRQDARRVARSGSEGRSSPYRSRSRRRGGAGSSPAQAPATCASETLPSPTLTPAPPATGGAAPPVVSPVAALGNFGGLAAGAGAPGQNDTIGAFCRLCGVDERAEIALRNLPQHLAAQIIAEGPVLGVNASAILMVRVHKAEREGMPFRLLVVPPRPRFAGGSDPVDAWINQYGVDISAENAFRALPPELQRYVINEGPLRGMNASALLMSRVRRVQGHNGAASAPRLGAGGVVGLAR